MHPQSTKSTKWNLSNGSLAVKPKQYHSLGAAYKLCNYTIQAVHLSISVTLLEQNASPLFFYLVAAQIASALPLPSMPKD